MRAGEGVPVKVHFGTGKAARVIVANCEMPKVEGVLIKGSFKLVDVYYGTAIVNSSSAVRFSCASACFVPLRVLATNFVCGIRRRSTLVSRFFFFFFFLYNNTDTSYVVTVLARPSSVFVFVCVGAVFIL